jgi:competence protein ComEA
MKKQAKVMGLVAVAMLALGAGQALAAKKTKVELSGTLNLNTATAAQLDQLPGVGEKAAKRIIEHRAKTPFAKVEDLRKVKGFGAKKLEKLKPYLTVSGPTTLVAKKVKLDAGAGAPTSAQGRKPGPGR